MDRDQTRQLVNVVATVIVIVVNALANILPLNGLNTGEISDSFKVVFVPAGYVFSIWGLIYLFLVGFTIYQALPAQRDNPLLRRIGYLYAVSCLANAIWIFMWHFLVFPLTLVLMLVILGCLIAIYLRLDIGRARVSTAEKWFIHIPFSTYLGWITVATIANVTSLLADLGWNGFGISPSTWAIILLVIGAAVAILMSATRRDIAYNLVIVWAFVGIAVSQADLRSVVFVAALMVVAVVLGLSLSLTGSLSLGRARPA